MDRLGRNRPPALTVRRQDGPVPKRHSVVQILEQAAHAAKGRNLPQRIESLIVEPDHLLLSQPHRGEEFPGHVGNPKIAVELPQASRSGRLQFAQQLDDFTLLAKLKPIAAVGDELAGSAEDVDGENARIGDHQAEHRRTAQLERQSRATDGQEANVKDRGLGKGNKRYAAGADQGRHEHAHEDFLRRLGGIEPEDRRDYPHRGERRNEQADGAGPGRMQFCIFRVVAKANRPNPAHETDQQSSTKP